MPRSFAVHWRSEPRRLFSFRQRVTAPSSREAREVFRLGASRRRPVVIGVEALDEPDAAAPGTGTGWPGTPRRAGITPVPAPTASGGMT